MPTIAEVRQQYPQYGDMTDQQLASALYKKFYQDMSPRDFAAKTGMVYQHVGQGSGADLAGIDQGTQFYNAQTGQYESYDQQPRTDAPVTAQGLGQQAVAGANEGVYRFLGAPVDLANTALRAGAAGLHALGGPDIQLPTDTVGGHQWVADQFAKAGVTDPATIPPQNEAERIARAGGEAATYALSPEIGMAGMTRMAPHAAEVLAPMVPASDSAGSLAANVAGNTAAGVGAQAAQDIAPEPYKPIAGLAGGMVGGGLAATPEMLAAAGAPIARRAVQPFTEAGQQAAAGQALRDAATAPYAATEALANASDHGIPGYQQTTGQASGDMGLLAAERQAETKKAVPFQQRRAEQNAARSDALSGMQSAGAPEQVATAVRQHIDAIDQQAQQAADQATQDAVTRANAIGNGLSPEAAGIVARQAYEDARAQAKQQERSLWQAVDPNGTMTLGIQGAKDQVKSILKEVTPMAAKPTAEEQAVYSDVMKSPDTVPLQQVQDLQSRLKDLMRQERAANGETQAYRRLTMLNQAVQNELDNAIMRRVEQDQRAVAAGQMAPEDTIASRLQAKVNDWYANREAGQVGQTSSGQDAGIGSAAVSGTGRTGLSAGRQLPNAPGNQGLSGDVGGTPVDKAALDRLAAARAATRERAQVFDNKTLAPLRKRQASGGEYQMGNAAVPEQLFRPGPKSVDALNAYQRAVGEQQALAILEPYAIDRLRRVAMNADGTISPAKAGNWMRAHADVLSAFPALKARVQDAAQASTNAANIAKAGAQTVKDAQQGVLARLMGLHTPEDVSRTVGAIFSRQDSVKQMAALRRAIGGNKDAQEGLKKAIATYIGDRFVGNTEAGTSGQPLIKSDQFQSFIKANRAALKAAGFSGEQIDLMDRVAASLQEANRSITAVKLPGRSNTAQDILAAKAGDSKGTLLTKIIMAASVAGGGGVGATHGAMGAVTGAIAGSVIGPWIAAMRQTGMDQIDQLVEQALLDPSFARQLMLKVPPDRTAEAIQRVGARFARSVTAGQAARQP